MVFLMRAAGGAAPGSVVQLHHIAVGHLMVAPDLLPVERGPAPDARVPERAREVLVNEPRDVGHRLAAAGGRPRPARETPAARPPRWRDDRPCWRRGARAAAARRDHRRPPPPPGG